MSVGDELTPVAASAGFGDEGAEGGDGDAVVTVTLSNVDVLSVDVL